MRKRTYFTALVAMLLVVACSGDGFVGGGGGIGGNITVAAVDVLASSSSLPSDPGQELNLTVIVRDQNNVAANGVTVVLSSDSGILTVSNPVTDANGVVTATLSAGGDQSNRTIAITADANGTIGTATISVAGTTLFLSGAAALAQGDSSVYTVVLSDAAGAGIANQVVDISSASGNTLAAASLMTDVSGQAQVDVTASAAGSDTITATALGLTATQDLNVSNDSFALTAPAAGSQIILNSVVPVDLTWTVGGVPQAGQTIQFTSTRGTLSAFSATTNAAGVASVTINSNNAGGATITATNVTGTTTSITAEFIAIIPSEITVQANPFTIGPGEQSAITAIVRDVIGNLVTNVTVQFVLTDVTGGQLSVAQALTDNQGRAQTFYTASSNTSASNGVRVTASVQSDPTISEFLDLTVGQRELFISIGTGNSIFEPNTAQYRVEYVVQISDAQGTGVEGVDVQFSVLSDSYFKGFWFFDLVLGAWLQQVTAGPCAEEDANRNGVLDFNLGEDFNGSLRIEAGNIATAVAQGGTGGMLTTDSAGFGIIDVFYPQDHAQWVAVTLEATTSVQGTEFAEGSSFFLAISGDDVSDQNQAPPGVVSPFGFSNSCADTD